MPLRHRVAAAAAARRPPHDDQGFAMTSPVAFAGAAAVALAGVVFLATDPAPSALTEEALLATAAAPAPVEAQVTLRAVRVRPTVTRGEVYVAVYNNSNVTGLAGRTSGRLTGAGWQVVTSDNWYGTIPATTVYFPSRLAEAARLLAKDLGITRVMPAVDPMQMDRLTLILTADFA